MLNKFIFISALLLVSSAAMAEQSLLEGATKQLAKDAATSVAPEAVEGAAKVDQAVEQAKSLKETVQAPDAAIKQVQEQAKDAATKQLEAAAPEEVKQSAETVKSGAESAKQLKETAGDVPKSSKQAKKSAKTQATQKALEMLR